MGRDPAQLVVERVVCNDEAVGSNPTSSIFLAWRCLVHSISPRNQWLQPLLASANVRVRKVSAFPARRPGSTRGHAAAGPEMRAYAPPPRGPPRPAQAQAATAAVPGRPLTRRPSIHYLPSSTIEQPRWALNGSARSRGRAGRRSPRRLTSRARQAIAGQKNDRRGS